MKRTFKIAAITVGLLLLPVIVVFVAVTAVIVGRQAVADGFDFTGIRIIKDGVVSAAVIPIGDGKVVLLDAGYDKAGKAILAELSRRQLTPEAVTAILLTHNHPDHVAAIDLFPKAEVMALESEIPLLEGRASWRWADLVLFPRLSGVRVTHVLHD